MFQVSPVRSAFARNVSHPSFPLESGIAMSADISDSLNVQFPLGTLIRIPVVSGPLDQEGIGKGDKVSLAHAHGCFLSAVFVLSSAKHMARPEITSDRARNHAQHC
jgi:hypothetical protein